MVLGEHGSEAFEHFVHGLVELALAGVAADDVLIVGFELLGEGQSYHGRDLLWAGGV
jgi:hypothetical protein